MSDAPKKRPWFQFHLSTAIVLMFVAGGLLWVNVRTCVQFKAWDAKLSFSNAPLSSTFADIMVRTRDIFR